MTLTLEEVRATAALARLALTDEECWQMRAELDAILGHMATLQAVDVGDAEPMTSVVQLSCPLRTDEISGEISQEQALAGAPARAGDFFEVPRIIAHDKEAS